MLPRFLLPETVVEEVPPHSQPAGLGIGLVVVVVEVDLAGSYPVVEELHSPAELVVDTVLVLAAVPSPKRSQL